MIRKALIIATLLAAGAGCGSSGRTLVPRQSDLGDLQGGLDLSGPWDLFPEDLPFGPGDLSQADMPDLASLRFGYPVGPYGTQINDTIADFQLPGYRLDRTHTDSTRLPWVPAIRLSDYHHDPACSCILLTIGAVWNAFDGAQQASLIADVAGDRGYCVYAILVEGPQNGSGRVTQADVDSWTQMYRQNFFVTMDMSNVVRGLWSGWGNVIGLPFILVIKADTMKIRGHMEGLDVMQHAKAVALCQ